MEWIILGIVLLVILYGHKSIPYKKDEIELQGMCLNYGCSNYRRIVFLKERIEKTWDDTLVRKYVCIHCNKDSIYL